MPRRQTPAPSESTFWFQAQKELARGIIVGQASLNLLRNYMHVLKATLDRVACEYRAGTAHVVGNIYNLRGHADSVGTRQA